MTPDGGLYAGSVVLVTGARKGLGRLLAEHFLAEGAQVIGISRGEGSVQHPGYSHYSIDIGDDAAVRATFGKIARDPGKLDIVINNAAVLTSIHAMLMPATRAEEMVRTNFLGSLYISRESSKLMRKHKYGRIINIGSMAVAVDAIGDTVYAAMKAASMTVNDILAKELGSYGITVNTMALTALETDMLAQLPRAKVDEIIAGLPLPRLATPDDIFNVIDFFASPRSSYVTAQTVFLGGVHA